MLRRSYRRRLINDEVLVKCVHEHWRVISLPILYTILLLAPLLLMAFTISTSGGA